ncbi:MAG: phosphoribosylformylglycinamidine synthase subunit PurQ, partial [Clostridia bacterium]|nr:phosphoribosylformylglycinamidine synthase subunit PurQ [Clostridia bacterium]
CNDFGAGGVSVAIGELADGLEINLNAVPKKYEGLDGTELAISESQERMAVVVAKEDVERFKELADSENLEATVVAVVKAEPRLRMFWNGNCICDISREFLNSNGAQKHTDIAPAAPKCYKKDLPASFADGMKALADDLNTCSKRGLSERFDSTIGAGTVMMPFGGKYQLTPNQAMVNKVSVETGSTDTVSYMAWGYNPYIAEKSPYHSAYLAVVESVTKLIGAGASFEDVYLTFQEYFEKPNRDPKRWGKPLAALLGAFKAQLDLGIGSIGGKDSMSGSFEDIDVPPTLVSFAVTTGDASEVISPEFKKPGNRLVLVTPETDANGLPVAASLIANFNAVTALMRAGKVLSASTPTLGGVADLAMKNAFGNGIGVRFENIADEVLFGYNYGALLLELTEDADMIGTLIGYTTQESTLTKGEESVSLDVLLKVYEDKLEPVFSCNIATDKAAVPAFTYSAKSHPHAGICVASPRVLIPVFPGTNCEFDTARALAAAGATPEIFVIRNLTASAIAESVEKFSEKIKQSQIIFIPGGFSGGDEPDGSAKFITSFFRNALVKDAVHDLLQNRDGLMAGICNGFQALVKLGLVPYGEIIDTDENCPTLTYNRIARHQSRIVHTRIASNKSPWLMNTKPGDIYTVPISHGEGRFLADEELIRKLAANGQIATQYVDLSGNPTNDIRFNPNGSSLAVEGITSPDGRVFGKMGHSERKGSYLYKNVPGEYEMGMFDAAVKYFK